VVCPILQFERGLPDHRILAGLGSTHKIFLLCLIVLDPKRRIKR